ncbi:MAG: hypothetical protein WC699_00725 [Bacteroidales bacterium]|jgi:hypothetical protein
MTKLSTLNFLVNVELGKTEEDSILNEINLMEDIDSDMLVRAPEAAVRNILGFARSYASLPSILLAEIEVYKN